MHNTKIKKEKLIRPLEWEIVPLEREDKDTIIAYMWGIVPIRIKGSGLSQDEFDKLYPAL